MKKKSPKTIKRYNPEVQLLLSTSDAGLIYEALEQLRLREQLNQQAIGHNLGF